MFVDGLQSTLTSLLCDGKQCGRTAEVSKHIGFYDFAEGSGKLLVGSMKASLSALFFPSKLFHTLSLTSTNGCFPQVIGVTRPDSSRRSLQSNHDSLMVVVVVTGIDADGLASAISGAAEREGWADAAALDAVSLTQSIRRNGLDNAASSGAPQALLMLALLCTVFLALA